MNMQQLVAEFVQNVRAVLSHEIRRELISQIANGRVGPATSRRPAEGGVPTKRRNDLGTPEPAKILEAIDRGIASGNRIAKAYDWSQSTTAKYMREMEAQGLIGREGGGRGKRWFRK